MNSRNNIVKNILALLVVLTIFLPSGLSLAHTLENHEHYEQCDNPSDVHFHDKKVDCDFQLVAFDKHAIIVFAKATTLSTPNYCTTQTIYTQDWYNTTIQKEPSRGPPMYQQLHLERC